MRSCRRKKYRASYTIELKRRAAISVTTENKPKKEDISSRRFTREIRLLDAGSFERVFEKSNRSRDTLFTVLSRANGKKAGRLGLAISKKNCRLAVQRNRLKRVVRESFRLHQEALGGLDVVVMSRPAANHASNRTLFDSLAGHWQKCRTGNARQTGAGREPNG